MIWWSQGTSYKTPQMIKVVVVFMVGLFPPDSNSQKLYTIVSLVWLNCYFNFVFSSRGLPKKKPQNLVVSHWLIEKNYIKIVGKEVQSSYKSPYEKAIINFILRDLQLCLLNMIVHRLKGESLEKTILR